ncbi:MAG: hypothetical protein NDI73_05640, partial [Desulfuromonadales bacterium]|nr:hypothetical protein [Desulfuromonadales bacterium]
MSSLVRIICLTFCGVLCLLPPAHAAPALVNYQGALAGANGVPLDGPVTVTFAIHEAPVAGVPLWQEVQVVQVQQGAFAVLLGSETPFPEDLFAADALWLELVVGSETLAPRQRLASVPYALNARRAGCNPGDFILCYSGDSSGIDVGICRAGKRFCLPDGSGFGDCSGEILPSPEICDGVDNDCDLATADGVNEPTLGNLCDGTDADLCMEGTVSCVVGKGLGCSDVTGNTLDICNGSDDDCDAASADGSEDPQFGQACDGTDSDLCLEGTRSCSAGTLICSDSTGSVVDVCNGSDDDCDAASADGSEDPL